MCLVVLLGAVLPRLTLALLWFFTEWTRVLAPWWLGFLGFLVLPYTTLAYVCIHHWSGDVSASNMGHLVIVLVSLLMDAGSWGGSHKHYRARS
jgi:formate hydrogenlyase subunit 3/multisubunit Na+/H+ antiporter MnhD subunit